MSESPPFVSVIMSVYDGHKYLGQTIESVLGQTYRYFEFIIIDDGSSDGSLDIIQSYKEKDSRIILIQNETNIGLALSLNKGIQIAQGKYLARMDADDICLPDRFKMQVEFLEQNPGIWILGCNVFHIDEQGEIIKEGKYATDSNDLRWNMLFGKSGVICHPCVMMVAEKIRESGLYDDVRSSQDLELFSRFILLDPLPLFNLQIPLVKCRWHSNSFSIKHAKLQHEVSDRIRLATLNRVFEKNYPLEVVSEFRTLTSQNSTKINQELISLISTWFKIWKDFQTKFNLSGIEMKPKFEQLFFRIKNLIVINPFSSKSTAVHLCKLIPLIGITPSLMIIKNKLSTKLVRQ